MESARSLKYLVGLDLAILLVLLGLLATTPLMIRHGIILTDRLVIEEETIESALILILLAVSLLILRAFNRALDAYRKAVRRKVQENAALSSRLVEAFDYIGAVNVEIQEIGSILCGVDQYPRTRRELKRLIEELATKAMTVCGAPWIVIRVINRCSGRMVSQWAAERFTGLLPPATVGNRAILEGRRSDTIQTISTTHRDLELLTVAILPALSLGEEETLLVKAIVNQVEMLFLLFRAGGFHPHPPNEDNKEITHDARL